MEHAPHAPTSTRDQRGWRGRIALLVAALAAIAAAALVAMHPNEPAKRTSLVEEGGLEWGPVTVVEDDGAQNVRANVTLDGEAFPAADGKDDQFVLYQLGGGAFDSDEHMDDAAAERVIGLDDDDNLVFSGDGLATSQAQPSAGEYSMSLDGTIEYTDIPKGRHLLRAYVVDRGGRWDGEVATRTVTVK